MKHSTRVALISLRRCHEKALALWKSFWAYYLSLSVSPLSLRALEMTRGCASVHSAVWILPLTVLLCWHTLCLLALFPRQPAFDESFNLMLLRLHGFNFAISLAYYSQGFFPMRTHSLLGDVLKWPPDLLAIFFFMGSKARTLLSSNYYSS